MEQQWVLGLIGGSIAGLGGVLFLTMNGRVLGSSGILGGLVDGSGRDSGMERIAFIAGLVGVPGIIALVYGAPQTHATDNIVLLVCAGLLTGVGTRLANGCTSGHAISGISRFAPRAMAATATYTLAAVATVGLMKHFWGMI